MFVPGGWWHAVLNLDDTMAVTQNIMTHVNFDSVWRSIRSERRKFAQKYLNNLKQNVNYDKFRNMLFTSEPLSWIKMIIIKWEINIKDNQFHFRLRVLNHLQVHLLQVLLVINKTLEDLHQNQKEVNHKINLKTQSVVETSENKKRHNQWRIKKGSNLHDMAILL